MSGSISLDQLKPFQAPEKMLKSVKTLAESPDLTTIPSAYACAPLTHDQVVSDANEATIPTIDFSLLTSGNPDQRSKTIRNIACACEDWGFFMVTNHGVPESVMNEMIDACKRFFDLTEEEKRAFVGKHVLDPIRYGTSFNAAEDKVLCWRDYLKLIVHPGFHAPPKPAGFREVVLEYTKRVWRIQCEFARVISESLGLEDEYMNKALDLEEEGTQILAANLYPLCPNPEMAMGMPSHSDHGLMTFLIHNGVNGLQIQHKDKWVNVNALPNTFLVNVGDQLEVLSNGKYKSVLHRAVVNKRATRVSIATVIGPPMDQAVRPVLELVECEHQKPAYIGMTYKDYLNTQQSKKLDGKSCLDQIRIQAV